MFGEIGIEKIFLLLLVVLLLFGAKRIPEIGSSIGRGIREFKRSVNDLQNEAHAPDAAPGRPPGPAAGRPASRASLRAEAPADLTRATTPRYNTALQQPGRRAARLRGAQPAAPPVRKHIQHLSREHPGLHVPPIGDVQ